MSTVGGVDIYVNVAYYADVAQLHTRYRENQHAEELLAEQNAHRLSVISLNAAMDSLALVTSELQSAKSTIEAVSGSHVLSTVELENITHDLELEMQSHTKTTRSLQEALLTIRVSNYVDCMLICVLVCIVMHMLSTDDILMRVIATHASVSPWELLRAMVQ